MLYGSRMFDAEKVTLAVYQLQEIAHDWWRATRVTVFPEGVVPNWNAFSEAFIGKFFSAAAREQKLVEFQNLRQGNMTIEQYEAEFARLSKYASRMVDNPLDKARRFRDGLQLDLRSQPGGFGLQNYEELYRRGQPIERDMRERRKIAPGPRFVPRRDNRNFGKRPMMNNG
ncbi:uncharacterized protein LOC125316432 [Rhodamnia argentea]|uniref:Uncharacterized protein LOC125316432 n=1 Tax=Rhodamnia argentea TaxID=178133 RepID=A0ABM3HVU7_9MYRT|nr:uncharacterized protein LOC125316432 [Rhodamnia argentea]